MGFWNTWTYKDITKFLTSRGFWESGSKKHPKWTNGKISFPIINIHSNGDVWEDTLKQIIKNSEISRKEWEQWKKKEKYRNR